MLVAGGCSRNDGYSSLKKVKSAAFNRKHAFKFDSNTLEKHVWVLQQIYILYEKKQDTYIFCTSEFLFCVLDGNLLFLFFW